MKENLPETKEKGNYLNLILRFFNLINDSYYIIIIN